MRAGRYTAALLLVCLGAVLIIEKTSELNIITEFIRWWPVWIIALGVEYVIISMLGRNGEGKVRFDFGGVIFAVIVALIVAGVSQGTSAVSWIGQLRDGIGSFAMPGHDGLSFPKDTQRIAVGPVTDSLVINNVNGDVRVDVASVDRIEVGLTVYTDKMDEKKAKSIADMSYLKIIGDDSITITAHGEEYRNKGTKRKPRMDLVIKIPVGHDIRVVDLQMTNGKAEVSDVRVVDKLSIDSKNGRIELRDITGGVKAKTMNGTIRLLNMNGPVEVDTMNGAIEAENVQGEFVGHTMNGKVSAKKLEGKVTAESTNGAVTLTDITGDVKAHTTNGKVSVSSHTVGGDWSLDTTVGSITVEVPADSHFTIKGSSGFGSISTDLPLTVEKNKISGKIGTGEHTIELDTNGRIEVNAIKP